MTPRIVTLAAAIAVLAACQSALPPGAQPMTAAEVRAIYADRTISGVSRTSGNPYSAFYAADGTIRLVSGAYRDTGHYRIEDNGTLCMTYQRFNAGAERCFRYFRDGATVWQVGPNNDALRADTQGTPGNPQGL